MGRKAFLKSFRREQAAIAAGRIYLDLQVPKARATGGGVYADGAYYWRPVSVDLDGTVAAEDPISGHYSLHHDLTEAEIAEARRLAGLVRAGKYRVVAGVVVRRWR